MSGGPDLPLAPLTASKLTRNRHRFTANGESVIHYCTGIQDTRYSIYGARSLPRNDWLGPLKKYFAEKWSTEIGATTAVFAKNVMESLLCAMKFKLQIWSSK